MSSTSSQDVREPYIYAAPWIALGAERPLEAYISGTVLAQQSAEVQLQRFSGPRFVPQEAERYDVARASSTKTHQGYVIVRRTEFNSPDSAFAAIGAKVRNGLYRAAKEYKGEEETNNGSAR